MAVNYGLGGFKNGASYYNGDFEAETIVIPAVDTYVPLTNTLTTTALLECSISDDVKILIGLGGYYYVKYSITSNNASNDLFQIAVQASGEIAPAVNSEMSFNQKQGDEFTTTSTCILKLDKLQTIQLMIANNTDDTDIDITMGSLCCIRIGDLAEESNNYLSGNSFINLRYSGTDLFTFAVINTFYPFTFTTTIYNHQQIKNPSSNFEFTQDGYYLIEWNIATYGVGNDDLTMGLMLNGNTNDDILPYPQQNWNVKGGSEFQCGFSTIMQRKKGDQIYFAVADNTHGGLGSLKFRSFNAVAVRIGNI